MNMLFRALSSATGAVWGTVSSAVKALASVPRDMSEVDGRRDDLVHTAKVVKENRNATANSSTPLTPGTPNPASASPNNLSEEEVTLFPKQPAFNADNNSEDREGRSREQLTLRERINAKLREQAASITEAVQLSVSVCTWNVAQQPPPEYIRTLRPWLFGFDPGATPVFHDIFVIGLQEVELGGAALMLEVTESSVAWTEAITDCLNETAAGACRYKKVKTLQLVGMVVIFVAKVEHLKFVKHVHTTVSRSGAIQGVMGNKGAIGLRATLYSKRFLFIAAHFAPHENKIAKRNSNYHAAMANLSFGIADDADDEMDAANILEELELRQESSPMSGKGISVRDRFFSRKRKGVKAKENAAKLLTEHDYVFFFGDLNYRIHGKTESEVREEIENGNHLALLDYDELKGSMEAGEAFEGFEEGEITFAPTYKFDKGTCFYESSPKRRTPSWTDRILFHINRAGRSSSDAMDASTSAISLGTSPPLGTTPPACYFPPCETMQNAMEVVRYNSCGACPISDHLPVSAQFICAAAKYKPKEVDRLLFEMRDETNFFDEVDHRTADFELRHV